MDPYQTAIAFHKLEMLAILRFFFFFAWTYQFYRYAYTGQIFLQYIQETADISKIITYSHIILFPKV